MVFFLVVLLAVWQRNIKTCRILEILWKALSGVHHPVFHMMGLLPGLGEVSYVFG